MSQWKSSKSSGVAEGRVLSTDPSSSVTSSQLLQRNLKVWPFCRSLIYGWQYIVAWRSKTRTWDRAPLTWTLIIARTKQPGLQFMSNGFVLRMEFCIPKHRSYPTWQKSMKNAVGNQCNHLGIFCDIFLSQKGSLSLLMLKKVWKRNTMNNKMIR